ncbi:hypothetical protein TorRG33x02_351520 [Trema orientale]|uniref:Uncharacterized protein n=1 Tax=Trema orientale TaxID=63057 RepID=A0A2P5AFK3_TREOI|nr:hypothetical protein TorRG33x02_351520 [Trema orientale]
MAGGASRSKVASHTRNSSTPTGGVDAATGKLSIVFVSECQLAICANVECFNNEYRYIVHMHGSFHHKDWKHVPEEVRAPLRHYLLETFDIDLQDKLTRKVIDEQIRRAWRSQKYKLHTYFMEISGDHDLAKT